MKIMLTTQKKICKIDKNSTKEHTKGYAKRNRLRKSIKWNNQIIHKEKEGDNKTENIRGNEQNRTYYSRLKLKLT